MVAPLPFNGSAFTLKAKIHDELSKEGLELDEYKIYLGNAKDGYDQLHKAYTTIVYSGENGSRKEVDQIFEIEFFKRRDEKNKIIYWGWYGIRRKMIGQLKPVNKARGLRIRKNNIQIGSENTAHKLFVKDSRFNYYFIGEIHAFHDHLIPNARRDYFTENEIYFKFESYLKEFCMYTLHALCYAASSFNNSVKAIENYEEEVKTFEAKQKSRGFTSPEQQKTGVEELEKKKIEAQKAEKEIQKLVESVKTNVNLKPLEHIVKNVSRNGLSKVAQIEIPEIEKRPALIVDQLSQLPKDQRKLLSRVFETINKFHEKSIAESLINKIIQELKQK
jgi:molecular chaperone HtpG